jgi:hypothetical protein
MISRLQESDKRQEARMTVRKSHSIAALAPVAFLMCASANAAPLEQSACAALNNERDRLIASGLKSDMERGPEWAKTNLAADRLQQIQRLIAVEEQLSFRCDKLVTAAPQIKEPPKPEPGKAEASAAKPVDDIFEGLNFGAMPPPKRKAKQK